MKEAEKHLYRGVRGPFRMLRPPLRQRTASAVLAFAPDGASALLGEGSRTSPNNRLQCPGTNTNRI